MGQPIYAERQITIDLTLCDMLDFCTPISMGGEIEWVLPGWTKTTEPTKVIFKNFRMSGGHDVGGDVRSLIITLFCTRKIAGTPISDYVTLTIQE